jgi:hypothetical protein
MADVYSTRLLQEHELGALTTYTVPDGFIAIVRDIDVFFTTLAAGAVQVENPAGGIFAYFAAPVGNSICIPWRGRQVLEPGDEIGVVASMDFGTADLMMSGYLLAAP